MTIALTGKVVLDRDPRPTASQKIGGDCQRNPVQDAELLSASKLIETMESDNPNFAKQYFVDKAIDEAAFIERDA